MNKITELLDSMRNIRECATPGKWEVKDQRGYARNGIWSDNWGFLGRMDSGAMDVPNAKFVAASPSLCDRYDRALRVAIEILKEDERDRALSLIESILAEEK